MEHKLKAGDIVRVKKSSNAYRWYRQELLLVTHSPTRFTKYFERSGEWVDVCNIDGSPVFGSDKTPSERIWVNPSILVRQVEFDPFLTAVHRRRLQRRRNSLLTKE